MSDGIFRDFARTIGRPKVMTTDTERTLQERLRAEEARMQTLYEYVCTQRDKHQGDAFTDFNQVKHAISGRDPVLEESADRLDALEAERDELGKRYDNLHETFQSQSRELLTAKAEAYERCAQEMDRSAKAQSDAGNHHKAETFTVAANRIRTLKETPDVD